MTARREIAHLSNLSTLKLYTHDPIPEATRLPSLVHLVASDCHNLALEALHDLGGKRLVPLIRPENLS